MLKTSDITPENISLRIDFEEDTMEDIAAENTQYIKYDLTGININGKIERTNSGKIERTKNDSWIFDPQDAVEKRLYLDHSITFNFMPSYEALQAIIKVRDMLRKEAVDTLKRREE